MHEPTMMVPPLADGVSRLGTESAFTVLAQARAMERRGIDVVHLEIGEPGFPTPTHVVNAAVEAMRMGETGYCPAAGLPELRQAAAAYLAGPRDVRIDADDVLIASGAKPFLFFSVLACVNPGDEVIYPDPGFPIYRSAIEFAGGIPRPLRLRSERAFAIDVDELVSLLNDRTRLLILNSPNNPVGAISHPEELQAIASVMADHPAWILSDEVYARLTYDRPAPSLASLPGMLERTILVDSCSKTFSMTGWRCGFAAVPAPLREPLTRFFINSTSCVAPFVQWGAIAALTGPMNSVTEMMSIFRARRDFFVGGLQQLPGVTCEMSEGAFYAFADVSGTGLSGDAFAAELLQREGVALLAGSAFGESAADRVRFSFAADGERLHEALVRIERFLGELDGATRFKPTGGLTRLT